MDPVGRLDTRPHCPQCGKLLDGYGSTTEPAVPRAGDLCVCMYCTAPLEYTADGKLRYLDPDDFLALPRETQREISQTVARIRGWQAAEQRKKREVN